MRSSRSDLTLEPGDRVVGDRHPVRPDPEFEGIYLGAAARGWRVFHDSAPMHAVLVLGHPNTPEDEGEVYLYKLEEHIIPWWEKKGG